MKKHNRNVHNISSALPLQKKSKQTEEPNNYLGNIIEKMEIDDNKSNSPEEIET